MGVTILGHPAPLYDYIVSGPFPIRTADWNSIPNFRKGYIAGPWPARADNNATPRELWVYNAFGAGATQGQGYYKGIQATFGSSVGPGTVQDGMSGISFMPITTAAGLDGSYINPSWRRVAWFSWSMATSAGATHNQQTGILFTPQASQQTGLQWPLGAAPACNGGFGIVGDGAGDWDWQTWSMNGGVPPNPIIETVSLAPFITDPEDWNMFEVVLISAAGGRNASLELWINDALVLTRDWVNAPALIPLGPVPGADVFRFTPIVQAGPATGTLWLGDWIHRMGRFTRSGRELLS
ncbi:hypothetical protein LCGC14_0877610 [marine sediment metagenome]|uniref:Uncharacterized protein n=1 Tax=marine sediment metagenome TaxID=412755 RepID=A0A0F9P2V3_9ZZZZ